MKSTVKYRLSDATYVEPLVNKWAAWSFLLSPIPASLHLVDYQLKVMDSYLENPAVHVAASKDPDLVAGPFMNVPPARKGEVKTLLDETRNKQAKNIELAGAFMQFAKRLAAEAKGCSLEPYYAEVPELLRGYVELVYDYADRPSVRILEKLLYDSEFYDPTLQSFRIGLMKDDSSRAFILNTPRLLQPGEIEWNLRFDDPMADELFKLDLQPQQMSHILDILGGASVTEHSILPFLSDQPIQMAAPWKEKRVRIRYLGHACVLVEWNGVSILTDAYIPVRPWAGGVERFSFNDLPEKIDFVLITHNHQDHYVFESLLRLRHRIGCLVVPRSYGILYGDLSLRVLSQKLGFRNVMELDTLDSIPLPDGEIIGMPFFGEHADFAHGKIAYVVRCGKEQMLFAADSDCLDQKMYERMRKSIGSVQTVFLSVENVGAPLSWIIGPFLPQQPPPEIEQQRRYHACDCERALALMEALGTKRLYNYAMGLEPWMEHLLGLNLTKDSEQWKQSELILDAARGRGFWTAERLFGCKTLHLEDPTQALESDAVLDHWKRQLEGIKHFRLGMTQFGSENHQKIVRQLAIPDEVADLNGKEWYAEFPAFSIAALFSSLVQWTEQEEFVVAVCIKNHGRIQYFPLRVDVSENPPFNVLVRRVEQAISTALAFELPPSSMVEITKEAFKQESHSDVRLGFTFNIGPEFSESSESFVSADWSEMSDFEIQFIQQPTLKASLKFNSSCFDEIVIAQLAENFVESMRQGTRDSAQRVSEMNLMLQAQPNSAPEDVEAQFSF